MNVDERTAKVREKEGRDSAVLTEAAVYESFVVEALRRALRESAELRAELERFDRESRRDLLAALLMLPVLEVPADVAGVLSASGAFEVIRPAA